MAREFLAGSLGRAVFALTLAATTVLPPRPVSAQTVDATRFHHRATVTVPAAGFARATVPVSLFSASESPEPFDDLRVLAPDGVPVAWVAREVLPPPPERGRDAQLLDQGATAEGGTEAVLDCGTDGATRDELWLAIGEKDFVRGVTLASSDDRLRWTTLAHDRVWDLASANAQSRRTDVHFGPSRARFLRVTIEGEPGRAPLTLLRASVRQRPVASAIAWQTVPLERAVDESPDAGRSRESRFVFRVADARAGLSGVRLTFEDAAYLRRAVIETTATPPLWSPVTATYLSRAPGGAETLEIPVSTRKPWLRVRVQDGDDRPLTLRTAEGLRAQYELVFRAPAAGAHTLLLGAHDAVRPAFDLPDVLARTPSPSFVDATIGDVSRNPQFGTAPAPTPPWSERHRGLLGLALGILVALVAWRAFDALRTPGREDTP